MADAARLPLRQAITALSTNDPDHHDVFPHGRGGKVVDRPPFAPCAGCGRALKYPELTSRCKACGG